MVRKIGLVSGVTAALFLGVAGSASAGTLDQHQTSSNNNVGIFSVQSGAQTFTAGRTGVLDQADLLLSTLTAIPEPLIVEVRNTSAGVPGTSVLASGSIPNSAIGPNPPAFVSVTFATPAAVTAGTQYALVAYTAHTGNDALGWFYQQGTNAYSGGAQFITGDTDHPQEDWSEEMGDDFAFKTFVAPPPPTTPPIPAPTSPPTTTKKKKCKKHKKHHSASSAKKKCHKKHH
jgi:hypothetical protein